MRYEVTIEKSKRLSIKALNLVREEVEKLPEKIEEDEHVFHSTLTKVIAYSRRSQYI